MKALILAAGYGTRLYPLTKNRPKPLLPIGGKPIIEYMIKKIEDIKDIDEVLVVTNHNFFKQFQDWLNGAFFERIELIDDGTQSLKERLGAIGDMNFVIESRAIKDDLLVMGGDNFFSACLQGFLDFGRLKQSSCVGVYDTGDKMTATRYGVVTLDENSRLVEFQEKPRSPSSSLVAMCLYYFPKEKLKFISEYLADNSIKDTIGHYVAWLSKQDEVFGYVFHGLWHDIGDKDSYKKANAYIAESKMT